MRRETGVGWTRQPGVSDVLLLALVLVVLAVGLITIIADALLAGRYEARIAAVCAAYGLCVSLLVVHARRLAAQRGLQEKEIRKQNAIVALLLNDFDATLGDWLWETDVQGLLTYVSDRLPRYLGQDLKTLLGRPLSSIAGAAPESHGWAELAAAMASQGAVEGLLVSLNLAGRQTWWRMTARPALDPRGAFAGYGGAAHDMTDERRNEADLRAAKEAAEQASARNTQYVQSLSHQLRTPLNAIVGFSELLTSGHAEILTDETRNDYLRIIAGSGRQLQTIVKNVLEVTRAEIGTLRLVEREVDAAELAEVAVRLCQDHADKADVTIVAHLLDGVEIWVDVARMKELLVGVIGALVASARPGSVVEVRLERDGRGGLVFVIVNKETDRLGSDLADEGAPVADLESQMGIADGGLPFWRRVALLHGGDISVTTGHGQGARAQLQLPGWRVKFREMADNSAPA